jgi:hypothetical protein
MFSDPRFPFVSVVPQSRSLFFKHISSVLWQAGLQHPLALSLHNLLVSSFIHSFYMSFHTEWDGRMSSWVESYVTTDGQPASLSWNKAPIWGLRPDLYYLYDSCGFVDLERPLWREDGSVLDNCCWPSPVQSFSGPNPVGFLAIFYFLRFETSLFVASYDSQGHGGGIRPRLHTGVKD